MSELSHIKRPLALRIASVSFISLWCLIAAFPSFWSAVVSVKARATPDKYPRRAGMPNKRPL